MLSGHNTVIKDGNGAAIELEFPIRVEIMHICSTNNLKVFSKQIIPTNVGDN